MGKIVSRGLQIVRLDLKRPFGRGTTLLRGPKLTMVPSTTALFSDLQNPWKKWKVLRPKNLSITPKHEGNVYVPTDVSTFLGLDLDGKKPNFRKYPVTPG